jgi:hypothetical protein
LVGTKRGKSCKAAAAELTFAIKVIGILIQVVVVYGLLLENQGYFSMKKTPHHTTPHHTLFETLLDFPHSSQLDL